MRMLTQRARKKSPNQLQLPHLSRTRNRTTRWQRMTIRLRMKKVKTLTKSTKSWVKVLTIRRLYLIDKSKVRMHRGCKRNHLTSIWLRWHKSVSVIHLRSSRRPHPSKARKQRRRIGLSLTKSLWSTLISSCKTPQSNIHSSWTTSRREPSIVSSKATVSW